MGVPDSSPVCLSDHHHHHHQDSQFSMEKDQCCNNIIPFSRRRRRRRQPSSSDFSHQADACSQTAPAPPPSQELLLEDAVSDSCTSPLKKGKSSLPITRSEDQEVVVGVTDGEAAGNSGGGCKTPTSVEKKIPTGRQLFCPPPPPRKPKTLPLTNKQKGLSSRSRRVLLDLSDEIESLFPPALLADFGNKIKKVRKETFII